MKNTMNRTREDVCNYIRIACGQYMANRICRMMDCFNTVEAFINADKGGLAFAFRKAYPKNRHDLGAKFFHAHNLVRIYCAEDGGEQHKEPKLSPQPACPVFTFAQMKAIVNVMELCGIKEIDIPRFQLFLASCNVNIANIEA